VAQGELLQGRQEAHRLSLHGQRAVLELEFYCLTWTESVTILFCVLDRIPLSDSAC
jgi:hypothetical protein